MGNLGQEKAGGGAGLLRRQHRAEGWGKKRRKQGRHVGEEHSVGAKSMSKGPEAERECHVPEQEAGFEAREE